MDTTTSKIALLCEIEGKVNGIALNPKNKNDLFYTTDTGLRKLSLIEHTSELVAKGTYHGIVSDGSDYLFMCAYRDNRIVRYSINDKGLYTLPIVSLMWPRGIAIDNSKRLYVLDRYHIKYLNIANTGIKEVIAGQQYSGSFVHKDGKATDVTFSEPEGIVWHNNAIYVSDIRDQCIRKVDLNNGTISTVVGTPASMGSASGSIAATKLYQPSGLLMHEGKLLVADSLNNRVLQVDFANEKSSALSGILSNPTCLAKDQNAIYIGANSKIYIYPLSPDTIQTASNNNNASQPIAAPIQDIKEVWQIVKLSDEKANSICSDTHGHIYIGTSNSIAKIDANTKVLSIIPELSERVLEPSSMAIDRKRGVLYVADRVKGTIAKYQVESGSASVLSAPPFKKPSLALDSQGHLLIADADGVHQMKMSDNNEPTSLKFVMQQLTSNSNIMVTVAHDKMEHDVVFACLENQVFLIQGGAPALVCGLIDSKKSRDGPLWAASIQNPTAMVADDCGNIFVAEKEALRKIDLLTRTVTTEWIAEFPIVALALDKMQHILACTTNGIFRIIRSGKRTACSTLIPSFAPKKIVHSLFDFTAHGNCAQPSVFLKLGERLEVVEDKQNGWLQVKSGESNILVPAFFVTMNLEIVAAAKLIKQLQEPQE